MRLSMVAGSMLLLAAAALGAGARTAHATLLAPGAANNGNANTTTSPNLTAEPPAPAPASAATPVDQSQPARAKVFPTLRPPDLDHKLQFGFALLPGTGYRTIFPYQDTVGCGQVDKHVCSGRLPFFLDVQPSFGFAFHWDVLVDLRFGLEQDFTNTRQFAVAPGFRYWTDPEEPIKLYATIQIAYDTTAQRDDLKHNNDVAFRNSNGVMFEVMRNFGIYVQAGETIGFVRWLRFEIDLGVGVQARIP
jgi:hypothetical protein